jgi:hypothetical protein
MVAWNIRIIEASGTDVKAMKWCTIDNQAQETMEVVRNIRLH